MNRRVRNENGHLTVEQVGLNRVDAGAMTVVEETEIPLLGVFFADLSHFKMALNKQREYKSKQPDQEDHCRDAEPPTGH